MISGFILFSIFVAVAVFSYKRPRFEQRVIKNIPLADWLTILAYPFMFYFAIVMIVGNVLSRPNISILDFSDLQVLTIGILLMMYVFTANSIHFVAKVLFRYIPYKKHSQLFLVNEMFHGKLSHYLGYISAEIVIFMISFLEINHPLWSEFTISHLVFIVLSGVVMGISACKLVFYASDWFGGYNKPILLLSIVLLFIQLSILKSFRLDMFLYPVNLFTSSFFLSMITTFILKRALRISKLSKKRKLRTIAKLLHG